ncbi:hypothetical protein AB3662_16215 [Sorangium cellulosum]|uniref:hypothetical protein n=1 Tax=Sorangium cellulosum TaxID=56 RepID=UPI003D9A23E8
MRLPGDTAVQRRRQAVTDPIVGSATLDLFLDLLGPGLVAARSRVKAKMYHQLLRAAQ